MCLEPQKSTQMNQSNPRQKETLTKANRLITSGLFQAAIDLLLEHLESDPKSVSVLNALGRVYLLDKQPEKSVEYLRQSLDVANASAQPVNGYESEEFSDQDLAFIVAEAGHQDATVYNFEEAVAARHTESEIFPEQKITPDSASEKLNAEHTSSFEHSQTLPSESMFTANGDEQALKKHDGKTDLAPKDDCSNEDTIHQAEPNGVGDKPVNLVIPTPPADISANATPLSVFDGFTAYEDMESPLDDLEDINEESLWDDTDDFDIDFIDSLRPSDSQSDLESNDEDEELTWDIFDDLDDLDELDEFALRGGGEADQFEDSVTRDIRARQMATEVLAQTDWDTDQLPLLQSIFVENGWSACRVAIEQLIVIGVSPEELVLAREIRRYWLENENYWISFYPVISNSPYKQTAAAYKHMSWQEAFRIIDCFPSLPDAEEIYLLIEEAYDIWYHSNRIRRAFKVFFKFLKFRIGSTQRSLGGNIPFFFQTQPEVEWGEDSPCYMNTISPERQMLSALGIELNRWPGLPENKIKIIAELMNETLYK